MNGKKTNVLIEVLQADRELGAVLDHIINEDQVNLRSLLLTTNHLELSESTQPASTALSVLLTVSDLQKVLAYLLPVVDLSCISTMVQGVPLKVERPRRKRRATKDIKDSVVDKVRTEIEHKIYGEIDSGLNQTYSDMIRVFLPLLTHPTFR
jgi:hypothetical protein